MSAAADGAVGAESSLMLIANVFWMVVVTFVDWIEMRRLSGIFVTMADRALTVSFVNYFAANSRWDVRTLAFFMRPRLL
ncbi:hypothetical protein NLM31_07120 [Bradyrhizobium sp. CCGUVB4N]|uniref:hypothetical protein n=1 Tax=Bradyrhizobium sp. CCGUVB4N TaxID=2949631 RepID=UPI0020B33566|nr:hypothetical protein [Bradyrhizobium sp. CCGUVB4N]MCP3380180.1 hypothetical protein [Bradyrhizobium sp. CCGUVB4N]